MKNLCYFESEVLRFDLLRKFNASNCYALPRLNKIVLNMSVSSVTQNKKDYNTGLLLLELFSQQRPLVIRAKTSVSNFNLRKNSLIACKVTLRRQALYTFLFLFIHIFLPRIKNFDGFSILDFDKQCNLNLGLENFSSYLEIYSVLEKFESFYGCNLSFVMDSSLSKNISLLYAQNYLAGLQLPLR
jgi:large subunit ribosomal protein L5